MARKIYDIKPPKSSHKKEQSAKPILRQGKTTHRVARQKKTSMPSKRIYFISIAVFVLIVGIYLFFKLPKADVTIWPKVNTLSFQQTITADKSAGSIDDTKAIIPAQYFEASKTESQYFPSTGNADNVGQASGTITVFNKNDPPTPLTFKAGTHFISDSGKLFVALEKVVIPAAKKSGGKITAGSVQIKVHAAEGGDSYNIPPSNFSVPGLKGSAYYYSVYATSGEAMSGGYAGKVKKVTNDDIQGAKDIVEKKVSDDALSDLKKQISSDFILLDNAVFSNITSSATQTKSGSVADNFNYEVAVKASALAFKKSDIEQFAKDYIISQIPKGKNLLDASFKVDYSGKTIDVSSGRATIALNFSSGVYQDINKNSLSLSLMGKNSDQINKTINGILGDQSTKVKVNFWPFWVTSAPNDQKAVNIYVKFQ